MKHRAKWMMVCLAAISGGVLTAGGVPAQESNRTAPPSVDPAADRILRGMSTYMASLGAFEVATDYTIELVTPDGEKHTYGGRSEVQLERPNRLRSDRHGELAELSFFYDGKNVALFAPRRNLYATAPAPPTLDATIDFTRDRLGIEAPAADLLYGEPYEGLMEDVVSGRYLGTADVNGVRCHHLAYRGNQTDWQIWVQDGPRPLPCKYEIVTKTTSAEPEYTVELHDWKVGNDIPDQTFQFVPPNGAQRIPFLGLMGQRTPQQGGGR